MDITKFIEWAQAGKRAVIIEINTQDGGDPVIKTWVYDYDLAVGQFVKSASEIDLVQKKNTDDYQLYQRLKHKFETEKEPSLRAAQAQ